MSGSPALYGSESMRAEKRGVAGNSVLAAIAVTTLKIAVGLATGSLGILSEAAHSGLDLVAAIITLFSVQVSDKPADADHQYGHGKVENFSAFIETGLLLLTCIWIVYEAFKRLFFHHVEIEPSLAAFLVMFFSMIVDYWRSRALGRIAAKYDSQALEADALHFSTDIWSSGVVVLGLSRTVTFQRSEQVSDAVTSAVHDVLPDADVVVHSIPRAVNTENIFDRVRAVATLHNLNVHDVSVQDLRGSLHVEQHLELDERLTLKEAHDRVTLLESEIRHDVPEISSILTHIESEPSTIETGDEVARDANLEKRLKAIAAKFPEILDMHDVELKRVRGRL